MIITKKKELRDVLASLDGMNKVWLFGCDSCAEQCQTGGKKELEEMAKVLRENGVEVLGSSLVEETCYRQLVLKEFRTREEIGGAESFLILACGAGVKTVAEAVDEEKPVVPALDTTFLATVERYGRFFEGCSLCGECVLGDTGGICPHTDCPKGLLNGPCGGVVDGKCEVCVENDCAWIRIYRRLAKQGRLHVMRKKASPKDHSSGVKPRNLLLRNPARPAGGTGK